MDEKEPPPAFMSALTTEHFVLQSALSGQYQRGRHPSLPLHLLPI
jgi:hypothetical protein